MIILLVMLGELIAKEPAWALLVVGELIGEFAVLTWLKHRGEKKGERMSEAWSASHVYTEGKGEGR